jgi:hypothetical protein
MILGYIYTVKLIKFSIPWKIIFRNIILWIIMFSLGHYLLTFHSIWLYQDVLVYGIWLFILYWGIIGFDIKQTFSNDKKRA